MPRVRPPIPLNRFRRMRETYLRIASDARTTVTKATFSRRLHDFIHDLLLHRSGSWKYGASMLSARVRVIAFLQKMITPGDEIVFDSSSGFYPKSFGETVDGYAFFPFHNGAFVCSYCSSAQPRRDARAIPRHRRDPSHGCNLICTTCRDLNFVQHEGVWMTHDERDRMIGRSLFSHHDSPIDSLMIKQFGLATGEKLTGLSPHSLRGRDAVSSRGRLLPTSHLKNGEPLWLGVELEVQPTSKPSEGSRQSRDRAMTFAAKTVGSFAILKHDGSLDPGGFEICSVPGTLEWHRQVWKPFLEGARDHVRGFRAGPAPYGMHVHVSRDSLGVLAAGRMMAFIHNPNNYAFITHIAGRDSNTYVQYDGSTTIGAARRGYRHHYDAAGPSHGKPTIEIRIFRSNVSPLGFMRNLEFTHALATWCQVAAPATTGELTVSRFAAWFAHPAVYSQYPALAAWFKARTGYRVAIKDGRRVDPELADA